MGDFDSPYNTYGLSTSFLEGLGIQGPLYNKIFIANVSISHPPGPIPPVERNAACFSSGRARGDFPFAELLFLLSDRIACSLSPPLCSWSSSSPLPVSPVWSVAYVSRVSSVARL